MVFRKKFSKDPAICEVCPVWRILPLSIMAKRSAISSTSDRICVEKKIVLPWDLSVLMRDFIWDLPMGSSPLMGSSRMSSFGLWRSDIARPSLCFMPFE